MTGKKDPVEERFLKKLEKLILSRNIKSAKTVAKSLEGLYETKIEDFDASSADPEILERKAELVMKMGDVHRILREHDRALDLYQKALDLSPESRTAVETYMRMGQANIEGGKWKDNRPLYERALEISRKTGYREGQADAIRGLGYINYRLGKLDTALDLYRDSLKLLEDSEDSVLKAKVYMENANVLGELNRYPEAKDLFNRALKTLRHSEDYYQKVRIHNNLGYLHTLLEEYREAKKHFRLQLKLASRKNDKKWMGWALSNLSEAQALSGDPGKGLESAKKAEEHLTGIGDDVGLIQTYSTMGLAHGRLGDPEKLKENYEKALEIADEKKLRSVQARTLLDYARDLGEHDRGQALLQARKALKIYEDLGLSEQVEDSERFIDRLRKGD